MTNNIVHVGKELGHNNETEGELGTCKGTKYLPWFLIEENREKLIKQ